ncbi:MAG: hypothetical protein IT349_06765 [Candidatus Eisenbacteria bacterium]|nr:hypothetical protein [Candidatus Eisenbacteria bacterium]MCC7141790.1 hypothetical protein [Candidatus Eisenbacteria bacterium]
MAESNTTTMTQNDQDIELILELDILEEKIQSLVRVVDSLRDERKRLEMEVQKLRAERAETIQRLNRLVEKVDALGVGL